MANLEHRSDLEPKHTEMLRNRPICGQSVKWIVDKTHRFITILDCTSIFTFFVQFNINCTEFILGTNIKYIRSFRSFKSSLVKIHGASHTAPTATPCLSPDMAAFYCVLLHQMQRKPCNYWIHCLVFYSEKYNETVQSASFTKSIAICILLGDVIIFRANAGYQWCFSCFFQTYA